jgi:phage terminase large subunit
LATNSSAKVSTPANGLVGRQPRQAEGKKPRVVEVPHNFTPRSYQQPFFDAWPRVKQFQLCQHRRAGKDKACLVFMLLRALERVGEYWYLSEELGQIRRNVWDNRDNAGFKTLDHIPRELIKKKHESQLKIELTNGSVIRFMGTQDIDKLVGGNPVGVVISEWSLVDPRVLDQILGPIAAANGAWIVLNFTPRGRNWAYDLWAATEGDPTWYRSLLTVDDTREDAPGESGGRVVTEEYSAGQLAKGVLPDIVQQEYYCRFEGVMQGGIFTDLMEQALTAGRICEVPWLTHLPVFTVWDIGIRHALVVLFCQIDGDHINIFDCIEDLSGKGVLLTAKEMLNRPYAYTSHWAPHDIKQREKSSGKSTLELAEGVGIRFEVVPSVSVEAGIEYARGILNRTRFDNTKAMRVVNCLRQYHYEWDDKRKVFGKKPAEDWSSDCADAFRYVALVHDQVKIDRYTETTSTGMDEPIFGSGDDDYEPVRNRAGGFVSQERNFSLEEVVTTDRFGHVVKYYR